PFEPAVGGGGGAAGALHHGKRFQRDRADRHRAADRHRQEERDYDDRFRAGSGAGAAYVAGGFDLSGVAAALSADHDDDDGGAAGRAAAGAGFGHGVGVAAAAGHYDCGRFDSEPVADALYNAGDLFILRSTGQPVFT